MYVTEELQKELDFFKRTNGHFEINAGKSTSKVTAATNDILYMAMSASLVMDYSEDGFFEDFVITDKSISGRNEMQIDAYALIETDNVKIKQLHIFQFKLYDNPDRSVSPVELLKFTTSINNSFVHPEFTESPSNNEIVVEIKKKCEEFISSKRDRRIIVYCHYINNVKGITNSNRDEIENVFARFSTDRQLGRFSTHVYGLSEILQLAKDGKIQVGDETLDIVCDGQHAYRLECNDTTLGLPQKVIIGMCNVNEFIRLQDKYHHNQLYSENIRLYLGDRGNVNKDIIATITSNESLWFPYMNNGISIICDKMVLGNTNEKKKTMTLILSNMQIINGCQTVNALYNAKYGKNTSDHFHPANVIVRIYEISPEQTDFKMNIIKATNNQNSVKSFSLMANDPIQIAIADVLKKFDIIYDRKGEGKEAKKGQLVLNMVNVAIAYRAVYLFMARSLRAGISRSRVFQKNEYERVFKSSLLEEGRESDLNKLCFKLIIANQILDSVRDLIQDNDRKYSSLLPIFRKSTYYLAGYFYAWKKQEFDDMEDRMEDVYSVGNDYKLKGLNFPEKITNIVSVNFDEGVENFIKFYNSKVDMDKTDIDNLLKSKQFEELYRTEISTLSGTVNFLQQEE